MSHDQSPVLSGRRERRENGIPLHRTPVKYLVFRAMQAQPGTFMKKTPGLCIGQSRFSAFFLTDLVKNRKDTCKKGTDDVCYGYPNLLRPLLRVPVPPGARWMPFRFGCRRRGLTKDARILLSELWSRTADEPYGIVFYRGRRSEGPSRRRPEDRDDEQ